MRKANRALKPGMGAFKMTTELKDGEVKQYQTVEPGDGIAGEAKKEVVTATTEKEGQDGILEGRDKEGMSVEEIMGGEGTAEAVTDPGLVTEEGLSPEAQKRINDKIGKAIKGKKLSDNELRKANDKIAEMEIIGAAPTERPKVPLREDFETGAEYQSEMAKYEDASLAFNNSQTTIKTKVDRESRSRDEGVQRFMDGSEKMRKKFPDYDQLVTEGENPFGEFRDLMLMSSHPAEVAYYYKKNPVKFAELEQLSQKDALLSIGELAGKFRQKPKKTTKAPAIIKPLTAGTEAAESKDLSKIKDGNEWLVERNKQVRAKENGVVIA